MGITITRFCGDNNVDKERKNNNLITGIQRGTE
jgi:hypothetical protein